MEHDMTGFNERERGFETEFAKSQEQEFRAHARRDKMLGLWAAEKLNLSGDQAEAYAMKLVKVDVQEPGPEDVIRQVVSDFAAGGVQISEDEIRDQLSHYESQA
jgi:hypothetical protein